MKDICDIEEIMKEDSEMLAWLRNLPKSLSASKIADRFEALTNAAHNRKHWTGHE